MLAVYPPFAATVERRNFPIVAASFFIAL